MAPSVVKNRRQLRKRRTIAADSETALIDLLNESQRSAVETGQAVLVDKASRERLSPLLRVGGDARRWTAAYDLERVGLPEHWAGQADYERLQHRLLCMVRPHGCDDNAWDYMQNVAVSLQDAGYHAMCFGTAAELQARLVWLKGEAEDDRSIMRQGVVVFVDMREGDVKELSVWAEKEKIEMRFGDMLVGGAGDAGAVAEGFTELLPCITPPAFKSDGPDVEASSKRLVLRLNCLLAMETLDGIAFEAIAESGRLARELALRLSGCHGPKMPGLSVSLDLFARACLKDGVGPVAREGVVAACAGSAGMTDRIPGWCDIWAGVQKGQVTKGVSPLYVLFHGIMWGEFTWSRPRIGQGIKPRRTP